MKRGKEVTWVRSWVIAFCCQAIFLYEWTKPYFGGWRIEVPMQIGMMYFVVPLLVAMAWQSWKVFFAAVAIPVVLILGETLYFLIRLQLG